MSLTVINRPLGHKLNESPVDATVTNSAGEALFTTDFAHGLVDGDYVYVVSNFDAYNGFKYVDSVTYNTFKLRESENGDVVPFKQIAYPEYQVSVLQHGWLAVHQPIVYELESDIYPNNVAEEAYTPNTVVSQANSNGYTLLNLTAVLSDPTPLAWIELVGEGELAGAYQIISAPQDWQIVINLAYDASNSFTGYQVVKYYKNYVINVGVYAGLGVEHPWYSIKPYELAGTLQLVPDSDGRSKFDISEILRGYINTRNNLTLDTLPNNLDFMTGFYITYWESYDSSDGTDITTLESAATSDKEEFEGHAVNASMPFKSVYQSHMSDYLNEDVYLANWLLLQENPIAIVGYFFDLSFINSLPRIDVLININKELDGVVLETETLTISHPGVGVLRVPIEPESGFDRYCVYAYTLGVAASDGPPATSLAALSAWTNKPGGQEWTLGANPNTSVNGSGGISDWIVGAIATEMGYDYEFTTSFEIQVSGVSLPTIAVIWALMDSSYNVLDSAGFNYTTSGVKNETFTLNPSGDGTYLGFFVTNNTPFDTKVVDIESAVYNSPAAPDDAIPAQTITETICITILEECDSTFIPDDDVRLTEDGDFRILE